ncbi:MAG TPA: stage II sporulation protein M [Candidatus Aminicenantes bacterium]|nr:stage II sporulation protein M [Candidatus Aminicenantes bacterium]
MTGDEMTAPGKDNRPARAAVPRTGLIRRLYSEELEAWKRHYRRYFKHAARALGLGFVAGFLYFMIWPAREMKALAFVVRALEDIPLDAPPLVLALTLFTHNARASVVAVAAGLAPFLFLPILDPVINGGVLGLLCSVSKHQGLDVPRLILTQILPHGVFELTAVLYTTSLGLYLSAEMGKKALAAWRARTRALAGPGTSPDPAPPQPAPVDFLETYDERAAAEPWGPARNIVRSFVLVVLPLLFVAAAIEGLITPLLR